MSSPFKGAFEQRADKISTALNTGDAEQAAYQLRGMVEDDPQHARALIRMVRDETPRDSASKIIKDRFGDVFIADRQSGKIEAFAGRLGSHGQYADQPSPYSFNGGETQSPDEQAPWNASGMQNMPNDAAPPPCPPGEPYAGMPYEAPTPVPQPFEMQSPYEVPINPYANSECYEPYQPVEPYQYSLPPYLSFCGPPRPYYRAAAYPPPSHFYASVGIHGFHFRIGEGVL